MRWALRIAIAAAIPYLSVVALLYVYQRDMMYFPETTYYAPPSRYEMLDRVREVALETADGVTVLAWWAPPPSGRPTVLLLHGNATSLSGMRYRIAGLAQARLGVLALAYRGYSGGEGSPSEEGFYADARAALDFLGAQGVGDDRIALYGHSLGTGVATKMAAERSVGALILEAPFSSATDVAAWQYPFAPVDWLMTDRFDSMARIASAQAPLLVMHGDADEVIPQRFGRALFDAAKEPKESYWPAGADHADVFDKGGLTVALDFIERRIAALPTAN